MDFFNKPYSLREALVHIHAHAEARLYAERQRLLAPELARANRTKKPLPRHVRP